MSSEAKSEAWTHALCESCYAAFRPGGKPVRLRDPETEHCCSCGEPTKSGIYVLQDPQLLQCGGDHAR